MRTGLLINYANDFLTSVGEARDMVAEGIQVLAVPEPYSFDGATQLAYLASAIPDADLTSSVLPIYTRTPTLTAMTAASIDYLCHGRFRLGLGTLGPQVIEGFHGVPYDAPLERTREVVEICRKIWAGTRVEHSGKHYQLPEASDRGTGLGKPLAMIRRPIRPDIPIDLAALGPKNVELCAEIADGWQPLFFDPQRWRDIWGAPLDAGASRRSPDLGRLVVHAQVPLAWGGPDSPGFRAIAEHYALYIGGMGAPERNFYFRVACAYGFEGAAAEIQRAFLAGDRTRAADQVPDALIEATCLTGDAASISNRVAAFASAGVDSLYLIPFDGTAQDRLTAVRATVAGASAVQPR